MLIQPIIFAIIFLVLGTFMAMVAFHVSRYRYSNDASLFVFGTLIVIFILTGVLTFVLFEYSDNNTGQKPGTVIKSLSL